MKGNDRASTLLGFRFNTMHVPIQFHFAGYKNVWHELVPIPRLAGELQKLVDKMNAYYSKLTDLQADYLATDPGMPGI